MTSSPARQPKKPHWLLRRPDPAAMARLFCFPYSGCGATMYRDWPRWIGQIEVCLIQPPARQNRIREPHYETYERLAVDMIEYMPPYLDKPFGFFGHCGGALPGVELARHLDAARLPVPRRVFVSSQVAPHDGPYGRLLNMSADELKKELSELITKLGGQPTESLVELGLDLLIQDLEANKRYESAQPLRLPCGITAIGWTEDAEIPMKLMDGWQESSADCRYVLLDGGHFEFLKAPAALLTEFERDLGEKTVSGGSAYRSRSN